jgi:RNA-directed DNA polymerase
MNIRRTIGIADITIQMRVKLRMRTHQMKFNFHNGETLEEICNIDNLREAFKSVKRNKGSPGVDGVTIELYEQDLDQNLFKLRQEVLTWTYKPMPVKRVEIPKPNGKGVRLLGIPIIKDRILHMAIKLVLEPIFDPKFSDNSYGFRPERNQKQAILAAREITRSGKEFVVDIDLSKFFDRINHDRLIYLLGTQTEDKRILKLIGMILRTGIAIGDFITIPSEGSVQGSPLSPLLSNIVLDELDKELERRDLSFCRYADDCNIFVKTKRAAERVKSSITKFIEKKLKLKVNEDKSQTAKSDQVKFLGMTIVKGSICISKSAMNRAMEKIKSLIPRGTHIPLKEAIDQINTWYTGWFSYFKLTQYPAQLKTLEAHIRRRLRARIIVQHKRRRYLVKKLIKKGIDIGLVLSTVFSNKKAWKLSHTIVMERAFSNKWFKEDMGQKIFSDLNLNHWHPLKEWVKLT